MDSKQLEKRKKVLLDLMNDKIYVPMKIKELAIILQVSKEERPDLELVLMKVGEDQDGEFLDIVEDDEELYEVSNIFEKRLREFFDSPIFDDLEQEIQ